MVLILFAGYLAACGTETIELVSVRDAGADSGVQDSGTEDTGTADVGFPDIGFPDTGTPDMGTPDTGVECVCRKIRCMIDRDCGAIAGSTCDTVSAFCTRSLGTCTMATDCTEAGEWTCTQSPTSQDACL